MVEIPSGELRMGSMQHNDGQRTNGHGPLRTSILGEHGGRYIFLATLVILAARIPLLAHRIFDPDELQHVHDAWCVSRGMLLYRDFFEHHTPFYYYLLSPFFRFFEVAQSFDSAWRFLTFGRAISLGLTMISITIAIALGRRWIDQSIGLLTGLLLASQPVFFHKTFEMRPDVLALPLYLAALWCLLRGIERAAPYARTLSSFVVGGLCMGAAIMCTQKMLFVLPGLMVGIGVWLLLARVTGSQDLTLRQRLLAVMCLLGSICVPGALTWAAFALQHGGSQFIGNNFLLNAKWKFVAHQQLLLVMETSWPVLILCLLGATVAVYRFAHSRTRELGTGLLLCTLGGLIIGIPIMPVAHRQYYLMLLPIICAFAAAGLSFLVELAPQGKRAWLVLVGLAALAVIPTLDMVKAYRSTNDEQLARIRFVFQHTKPTDTVMDGWTGTGIFRPHAFYYFFLHEESVLMLPRERVNAFVEDLQSGKVQPRLIALDDNLITLGSRFVRFVLRDYESSDGFFYLRKGATE
jgi:4-amino-4-deoxy-L-arabinose transferase-like glycosyltransferase